jgi:outer membrane biogenesis lipoprotein LolB
VNRAALPLLMKAVLALISLLLLAACATVDSPGRAQLVGNWRYRDQVQSCQYSFKNDGSFTGEVKLRKKLISKFKGRWSVRGRTLLYSYLSDALGRIPVGATDRDQLLEIRKDFFFIQAANGERRRYVRMP